MFGLFLSYFFLWAFKIKIYKKSANDQLLMYIFLLQGHPDILKLIKETLFHGRKFGVLKKKYIIDEWIHFPAQFQNIRLFQNRREIQSSFFFTFFDFKSYLLICFLLSSISFHIIYTERQNKKMFSICRNECL